MTRWLLKISKKEDSIVSLGNLHQCSVILSVKRVSQLFYRSSCLSASAYCPCPAMGHHCIEPGSILFVCSLVYKHIDFPRPCLLQAFLIRQRVIEGCWVGQARFLFGESMLTTPYHLLFLHGPGAYCTFTGLLTFLPGCLLFGGAYPWAWTLPSLNTDQISWTSTPSRVSPCCTLPSTFFKRSNHVLLQFRDVILPFVLFHLLSPGSKPHHVMVPADKASFTIHIAKETLPGFGYEIQPCTCHGWFLYRCLRNLTLMSSINPLDCLCTSCIVFLAHIRIVEGACGPTSV